MQTILVAGGAGFIGSHLCNRLLEEGKNVICVDNLVTGRRENITSLLSNPRFSFIEQSVTMPLPESIAADAVFHFASPASPNHHSPLSYHALPMETMMANTEGTHKLLQFAKKNNARFLFASTSEAYGDPLEHPQREEYRGNVSTTGPRSVYDEAKRFGETLTAYYHRSENVDARIVRIFNTYGPHMASDDMRMSVVFVQQALAGKPITIFGDGSQTRSLCYIDDLVEGLMKFMFKEGLGGEVINIGNADEITVLEFAKEVKKIAQSESEIVFSEELPQDDPLKRRPDISKAKKLLGWEPKISLQEGIEKFIQYYKNI